MQTSATKSWILDELWTEPLIWEFGKEIKMSSRFLVSGRKQLIRRAQAKITPVAFGQTCDLREVLRAAAAAAAAAAMNADIRLEVTHCNRRPLATGFRITALCLL